MTVGRLATSSVAMARLLARVAKGHDLQRLVECDFGQRPAFGDGGIEVGRAGACIT